MRITNSPDFFGAYYNMKNKTIIFHLPLLLLLGFAFTGCSGETLPGMPQRFPAQLTVTQEGKPLEGAKIMLINTDTSSTWSGGGVTDKNGVAQVRTMGQYSGIPEGTYTVCVSKVELPDFDFPNEVPYGDKEAMKEYQKLVKKYEDNTFLLVDEKFSLGRSKLQVTFSKDQSTATVDVSPAIRVKAPPVPRG